MRVRNSAEAEDLTQAFFENILARNWINEADRDRGKFRSFLFTSVRNFVETARVRESAAKRGGATTTVSIDGQTEDGDWREEPRDDWDPAKEYDRKWAGTLLARAQARVRESYAEIGKSNLFEALKPFLAERGADLAGVAQTLGITANHVRVCLFTLRQDYSRVLREEIAHTVSGPSDIDEEIRHLLSAVGSSS